MSDSLQNPANSALVLFSGGQDSATCLAWALDRFERAILRDYPIRTGIEPRVLRVEPADGAGVLA